MDARRALEGRHPRRTSHRLHGKITLVIGGTRGIGRGVVERFAHEGATSVFVGRDETAGASIVKVVGASGGRTDFIKCDVLELSELEGVIRRVVRRYGRLDAFVNSAGTAIARSVLESTPHHFDALFDLNVKTTFFGMKWAAAAMSSTGGGSIINITSVAATRGLENRSLYCGTKAAVLLMSKAAALDLGRFKVRVNCISPGTVDTELMRRMLYEGRSNVDELVASLGRERLLGRIGTVDDIANAAVYLASDEAGWVTGTSLDVDGGAAV